MSKIDLIIMGVQNLWRRKLRTFLTVLGVIIGTSSIVVMLSLGFGMNKSMEDMISSMGSLTTINVRKPWDQQPGKKTPALDDKAVQSFKKLKNVAAVSPSLETYVLIKTGKYEANLSVKGIDPNVMEEFGFKIDQGRLLNSKDDMSIVFGANGKDMFNDPKARGQYREPKIDLMKDRMTLSFGEGGFGGGMGGMPGIPSGPKAKEYKIKTVGILQSAGFDKDYASFMTLDSVKKLIKEKEKSEGNKNNKKEKGYEVIDVKVNDMNNVQSVQEVIKDMGYEAYSLNDELESFKQQSKISQAILGGIGAISLLVAAIGITNTMIMSIYERTKEIGVMKVIGASLKDIKRLFLFESALIGFLGGMLGVVLSYLLSYGLNTIAQSFLGGGMDGGITTISVIPAWLAVAAMFFSALIGIASGYFPAKRAMNLSALEAIRTE